MNYKERIGQLIQLTKAPSKAKTTRLLENGWLDEYYGKIIEGIDWLGKMENLHPRPQPLSKLKEELIEQKNKILQFYQNYFSAHNVIGNAAAHKKPDFIFILACKNKKMLQMRVGGALPHIERHTKAPVVLCGGGFDPVHTEAELMCKCVLKEGVPEERLIFEDDSVDTIGNALFSKLKLAQLKVLPKKARLLVFTSAFHAVRSLNIFNKTYGLDYEIAVVPVKTIFDSARLIQRVAHELQSDRRSSREIFSLDDFLDLKSGVKEVTPGNDVTLLFQLILHHDFYRHRYDILRKYADVVEERQVFLSGLLPKKQKRSSNKRKN